MFKTRDTESSSIPVTLVGIELDCRKLDTDVVKQVYNNVYPGISYTLASNTLTLNNANAPKLAINTNVMGDDFTINDTMKELDRKQLSSLLGQDVYVEISLAYDFQGIYMSLDNIFTEF